MDIVRTFIAKHEQLVRDEFDKNRVIVDYGLEIEEIKPDFVVDARK